MQTLRPLSLVKYWWRGCKSRSLFIPLHATLIIEFHELLTKLLRGHVTSNFVWVFWVPIPITHHRSNSKIFKKRYIFSIIARLSHLTVLVALYSKNSMASHKTFLRPSGLQFYIGPLGTHIHYPQ